MEKVVGVDLGYGFVKAADGSYHYCFPSVVGFGLDLSYDSVLSSYRRHLDSLAVSLNGKTYFVGELAIRQSENASRSLDQNRADDYNAYVLFTSALGLFTEERDLRLKMVTGLPTSYFAGYKDRWQEKMKGQHSFVFSLQGKSDKKTVDVLDIHISPQPLGTLYDRLLNEHGEIENQDLAEMKVGIVDIGFKTADFVVADKMEFIDRLSFSSTNGLVDAYRDISSVFRRDFRLDKRDYDLDKILMGGDLKIAGSRYDISEIKERAFSNLAAKIKTELESLWDCRELDAVLFTGGGGQALADYLLPWFDNAVLVEQAQFANCRGFTKLSRKLFLRNEGEEEG